MGAILVLRIAPLYVASVLSVVWASGPAAAAEPKVLFEEKFTGQLDKGWSWVRESPKAWRLEDGTLVLDTLPGSLWQNQASSRNLLLRPAPVTSKEGFMAEVLLDNQPKSQFEHAGIVCYYDDVNWVAFNKEFIGKSELLLISEANAKPLLPCPEKAYGEREVWLRIVVTDRKVTGKYRASAKDPWQTLGERDLPPSEKPLQIGLLSGYGQEKPDRQARFRNFRLLQIEQ
jgi:regulation of enolase protein 1 (concanavalin A-like superfamily)